MALVHSGLNQGTASAFNAFNNVAASSAPKNPNPVESVSVAHEGVQRLVSRLGILADRLVGPIPTGVEADGREHSTTVFREIMDHADSIATLADVGMEAITRIERSLP